MGKDIKILKRICLNRSVLDFMESKMEEDSYVIEYGSGWSTRWFAERCRKLNSIETDPKWWHKVCLHAEGVDCEIEVRLTKNVARITNDIPPQIADLILIDCYEIQRHKATMSAWPLLKPGGWILFDDAQRTKHAISVKWLNNVAGKPVELEWQPGDVESAKPRLTLAWQKPIESPES